MEPVIIRFLIFYPTNEGWYRKSKSYFLQFVKELIKNPEFEW